MVSVAEFKLLRLLPSYTEFLFPRLCFFCEIELLVSGRFIGHGLAKSSADGHRQGQFAGGSVGGSGRGFSFFFARILGTSLIGGRWFHGRKFARNFGDNPFVTGPSLSIGLLSGCYRVVIVSDRL